MSAASASTLRASDGGAGLPRHVAIIMDGNGRWAKARHLPRVAGHRKGAEAVRATIRAARELGIEVLTLYAFSSENWRRPEEEVSDLKGLLRHYLLGEIEELAANGVRLRVIGEYRRFGPELARLLDDAIERTVGNRAMTLVIALNYGAQDEIVRAARALAEDALAGRIDPAAIDAETLDARLDTRELPPPDLLIRTSGERRLSNFLLWQAAYAELLFVDTLWPDFGREALFAAVADYGRRERRFGGL
ncbi:isoprenyl transferase [Edaphosphingomonas haloaromaticamans]|uniref:Isoprenyl transferase n=1 Tax=Edaphosphingomonas haloaromaticamans TaxID=653954 RepID=A0A1S1HG78_9SPHN|nr:isoprenyl transferase [Sphingomonas haloaromaticamans]OHT21058.1 Ditrans,polycis-undecaprenyl-diphosphate synthase ((2E,6E)-farnesyl-diphosphate specific) [Sphingomonas haloaromaticamans]